MTPTPPPYPKFTGYEPCATTDPEAFFPEKGQTVPKIVRTMCLDHCSMREQCLEWALWWTDDGFWGGTDPRERRHIRRERGIVRLPSRHQAA